MLVQACKSVAQPIIFETQMFREFVKAFVRYHRGLGKMPISWKPWLITLLVANMIVPWFWMDRLEAQVVFGVALLNYFSFVILTGVSGFSRLLGLGHIYWIPLIWFLCLRLELFPANTAFGLWIRAVIILDAGCLLLDAANVIRYVRGDHEEMVQGL
jgi:hypothetical protein